MIHQKKKTPSEKRFNFSPKFFVFRVRSIKKLSKHDVSKHEHIAHICLIFTASGGKKTTTLISMKGKRRHKLESF